MPDMPALLDDIREQPDSGEAWLALSSWLLDNGRDDEAVVVGTGARDRWVGGVRTGDRGRATRRWPESSTRALDQPDGDHLPGE